MGTNDQRSQFWTTGATGDGATAYTQENLRSLYLKTFGGGVLRGIGGELAVSGAASPLSVAAGAAYDAGFFYEVATPTSLTVASPTVGLTGGHVVLRADWAAQTVRLVAVRSADGVSALPTVQQNAGSVWEERLASFTIATNGVITLTDTRPWCRFSTRISTAMLDDGAVTGPKIAANAVSGYHVLDDTLPGSKIINGHIVTAKIADFTITGAKLANNAVDNRVAGDRVLQIPAREGGSSSNWWTPGSTVYTPGLIRVQAGRRQTVQVGGTISFPLAYSSPPIVLFLPDEPGLNIGVASVSTTGFTYGPAASGTTTASWLAIGPG